MVRQPASCTIDVMPRGVTGNTATFDVAVLGSIPSEAAKDKIVLDL